jgi:hypothetical protein
MSQKQMWAEKDEGKDKRKRNFFYFQNSLSGKRII